MGKTKAEKSVAGVIIASEWRWKTSRTCNVLKLRELGSHSKRLGSGFWEASVGIA